jgi:hypothetical protein
VSHFCGEPPQPPQPTVGTSNGPRIATTVNNNTLVQSQSDDEVAICLPAGGELKNLPMPCELAWRSYSDCVDSVHRANSRPVSPGASPPKLSESEVCLKPPIEVGSTSPSGVSVSNETAMDPAITNATNNATALEASLTGVSETTVANQPIASEVAIAIGGTIAAGGAEE